MALMFLSPDDPAELWREELRARMPELEVRIWPEVGDPAEIDLALVWRAPPGELARYPNLKAILSLAAGIEWLVVDPTLPDVPIARMVDPSLTRTMGEYVLLAVLRHHREFDRFEREQRARNWAYSFPPQAADRPVGIMGLGELGASAAKQLSAQGFPVLGWSRTPKAIEGVTSYAGHGELHAFLHRSQILVCLLPLTAETRGILDAETFNGLPHGACVINVARGDHLVEADLLAALDFGPSGRRYPGRLPDRAAAGRRSALATSQSADHASRGELLAARHRRRRRGRQCSPRSGRPAAAPSGRPRPRLLTPRDRPGSVRGPALPNRRGSGRRDTVGLPRASPCGASERHAETETWPPAPAAESGTSPAPGFRRRETRRGGLDCRPAPGGGRPRLP